MTITQGIQKIKTISTNNLLSDSGPHISVIVCCYGGEKTIKACLVSLLNQTLDSDLYEIIIVDDGSFDKTSNIVKEFIDSSITKSDPNFIYYRKRNEGLSIARNFGFRQSNAEYVVYIDEDAIAFPDYLSVILEYFRANPAVNCLGGEVELYNTESEFARLLQDSIFSLYMKNEEAIIGTNMAFRKSFLEKINGFPNNYWGWGSVRSG